MPIILLGALGGMISSGIIGLFIGAVILTVGYQIFMEWVAEGAEEIQVQPEQAAPDANRSGKPGRNMPKFTVVGAFAC